MLEPIRSLRAFRLIARRKKDALLASLVAFVGSCSIAVTAPEMDKLIASIAFTAFLMAAVVLRKKRIASYGLSFSALLVYITAIQPESVFISLVIVYPLLLLFALLLPNPWTSIVAALAIGLHQMIFTDYPNNYSMVHLYLIIMNALAYTALAFYARRLEKERNEYRHMSMIDSMTGLASLQQTLLCGQRLLEEGRNVRVLLIDLNFFKQINDSHGHMIGNKVIVHVADHLREYIRGDNGVAGRLGGDEFVLVVEDKPRYADLRERLLRELNGAQLKPSSVAAPIVLSFSVGEAVSGNRPNVHIEDLLHEADLNMYEYKLHHKLPAFNGKTADLIEHNPDPICTFDRKGKLLAVNPAVCSLLGMTPEQLTGRPFTALIHPQDHQKAKAHFLETMNGNPNQFELTFVHSEGHTIIVRVTNIPVIADHHIVGIYSIAKDVTEQRKSEELLRNSDRLAVMGQLAAGLAHEIRNPLTALKGFIQLLQSSVSDNKAYYPIMLTELERINLILNEFLLLSKPRPASFRETDIRVVVSHVVTLLDTQAILNKVRIIAEDEEDIPLLMCDENQMKQVFLNILKNGIEAMPNGGELKVRISMSGRCATIAVEDQGGGIPEHVIPRLGQPFFTTKEKGTGLGLMICHKIMENHGGRLSVRNTGLGASVEIELPLPVVSLVAT